MIVGVPKEIKTDENRVALIPAGATALVAAGHKVYVERDAGLGSGFPNDRYVSAGAEVLETADEVWDQAELIVKVKEPIEPEYDRMRADQVIFTYFHFAADEQLTRRTLESGCVAIAYETVQLPTGELPLLTPMSEVAGRMAIQQAAKNLERIAGGYGILLGGVPGVLPAEVVILGGGVVGANAATIAAGFGAHVTVLDVSLPRLRYLAEVMPANVDTLYSNRHSILEQIERADVVIGAVLVPGGKAPKLVRHDDLRRMKDGSVIVDVAVDQGGCVESARPTTHNDPTYTVHGVIHYCVANMPGAVPRTSTLALTNATFPYVLKVSNRGWAAACEEDRDLALGVNIAGGRVTYAAVAEAFNLEYTPLGDLSA
ncbi:alanine dehydrogenase [Candidatus Palauibacter sp.]|uniref:alanine dehydrogenase n=1 Tax=Candidatus Palauibacter sp. TaxID=3101350 RepID=UPI003B51A43C